MITYRIIIIKKDDKANIDDTTGEIIIGVPKINEEIIQNINIEEDQVRSKYHKFVKKYNIKEELEASKIDRFFALLIFLINYPIYFITNILGINKYNVDIFSISNWIEKRMINLSKVYHDNEDYDGGILWGTRLTLLGAGRKYENDKHEGIKALNFRHMYILKKYILKGYNKDYLKKAEKYIY